GKSSIVFKTASSSPRSGYWGSWRAVLDLHVSKAHALSSIASALRLVEGFEAWMAVVGRREVTVAGVATMVGKKVVFVGRMVVVERAILVM
ncbi:hypothetical protein KSS87_008205, partial [Heliosperma pusillum]